MSIQHNKLHFSGCRRTSRLFCKPATSFVHFQTFGFVFFPGTYTSIQFSLMTFMFSLSLHLEASLPSPTHQLMGMSTSVLQQVHLQTATRHCTNHYTHSKNKKKTHHLAPPSSLISTFPWSHIGRSDESLVSLLVRVRGQAIHRSQRAATCHADLHVHQLLQTRCR